MIKISGVIITYNEEAHIEKCLKSLLPVVDEIVVLDSFSTDNTVEICNKFNVKLIQHQFLGYVKQKNLALTHTSNDYIVSLDGDEALSENLQKSILQLKENWTCDAYYCNRYNFFCGQWIKHSDWYPNKKLRVFNKQKVYWAGHKIHEHIKLKEKGSKIGHLKGDILHYTYQSFSQFNQQMERFSTLSAESYFELGKKSSVLKIIWNPFWAFFKAYFLRLGFLDGLNGWVICIQTYHTTFLKYAKLYQIQKRAK